MVNYQTSQYKLLHLVFNLSRFGVFQYVRDILQVTVSIDHPVEVKDNLIFTFCEYERNLDASGACGAISLGTSARCR